MNHAERPAMTDQNQLLRELLAEIHANFVIDGYVTSAQMDKIAVALSHPAQPAPAQPQGAGEVAGYEVWWGVGDMQPHKGLFSTRQDAEELASQIKSNTEVRPVYRTTPPASQQAAQAVPTKPPAASAAQARDGCGT